MSPHWQRSLAVFLCSLCRWLVLSHPSCIFIQLQRKISTFSLYSLFRSISSYTTSVKMNPSSHLVSLSLPLSSCVDSAVLLSLWISLTAFLAHVVCHRALPWHKPHFYRCSRYMTDFGQRTRGFTLLHHRAYTPWPSVNLHFFHAASSSGLLICTAPKCSKLVLHTHTWAKVNSGAYTSMYTHVCPLRFVKFILKYSHICSKITIKDGWRCHSQ